jgi:hypothetical protein
MSGEIVDGSAATNGATILTVPVGRQWIGDIELAASLSSLLAGGTANPTVTIQSTGTCMPASGTVLAELSLTTPAVLTLSGSVADSIEVTGIGVLALSGTTTLQLNTGGATAASASASGVTP